MQPRLHRLQGPLNKFLAIFPGELIALLLVLFIFTVPAGASTRFENRSLLMASTQPGVTTSYKVSLDYMTPTPVGSLDMLFCMSPIPYEPCVTPPGLDVSRAVLENQTGETGFAISQKSQNHIVLSRTPAMIAMSGSKSAYTFNNIVNPTDQSKAFSIRLKSHESTNASGPQIDFGSVRGQVGEGIVIETQVPPMLIFCAAQEVHDNCESTNEVYYSDMGTLSENDTLVAQSQMAVGTNATGGFAIIASGTPLTAGTNEIGGLTQPTNSQPGRNQFGINLVENSEINVGQNPEGEWENATPTMNYSQPNMFTYNSGDVIAQSPSVSLMKKFTVSYIVNVSPDLRPGVYTTTINFIASGRF